MLNCCISSFTNCSPPCEVSYAEQKSFLEKWRVLADGRSSMSTAEFLDLLVNGSGMDRELATMVVKAYDLDGDGYVHKLERKFGC